MFRRCSSILIAAALLMTLAACGPEGGRERGGGLGADVGNHHPDVPASKVFNDDNEP